MDIRRRILPLVLLAVFQVSSFAAAGPFDAVKGMIERRIPFLAGKVDLKECAAPEGKSDAFTFYTSNDRLVIEASSKSAAAAAVNRYLEDCCHMSLSHNGDNLHPLKDGLPRVDSPVSLSTSFRYRYALNYCTYNYSYSFYDWDDWEKELDWMALQGINLMLAPIGCEIVWANVLAQYGYSWKEIQDYVAGPAYTAWWLMGNLEGWGGPMSRKMMEERAQMQRRILARMEELGIEPIFQGFWGMVPTTLHEKYPQAKIIDQGQWGRVFARPSVLLPEDPLFDKMADSWYAEVKRQFGDGIHHFGGDLFHEGGDTTGVHVTRTASLIQAAMQRSFPGSKWMLQGWSGNPKKELLAGLSPDNTVVIDLFGESGTTWKDTQEFYGTPWIWGTVNHFGGKTDMGGQLPGIIRGPHDAAVVSKGYICGVGIIPEGIFANPVVYDWAMRTAWEQSAPQVADYRENYIVYRYGKADANLSAAWEILTRSIYGDFLLKGEGTFESVFCARPGMEVKNVSTWGPKRFQYNPDDVADALVFFRKAADHFKDSDTYTYDLVDLARQVLTNHARDVYERSMKVYAGGDSEGFSIISDEFLRLLRLQDTLVGTRREFLVGAWLAKASAYGEDVTARALSEKNARMQITYWGPESATTRIRDYANKEWSGLLMDYYLPRWEAFYSCLKERLEGKDVPDPDYFAIEKGWVYNGKHYPSQPNGEDALALVDEVIAAVRPVYKDRNASSSERTEDLLSRMTLKEKTAQMRHLHFSRFDENGQVSMEKLNANTGGLSMGCVEAFPYSSEQYMHAMYSIQKHMVEETRLGIPVIPVMEGLHGVVQDGCTVFPQAIAQAATFNTALETEMASVIADEMTAIGARQVLAPDLDIARELRWGRVEETFGEDPLLVTRMGDAYVKAMQEKGRITTLKHFVAHGTPSGGLNLASVRGGERELRDFYLVPFREIIASRKPLSVMNCYSSYDGEAVTGSKRLMTDLLRNELGFDGYVYSDWGSVGMLRKFHMAASTGMESSKMAVEAGIDLEAGSGEYQNLEEGVRSGVIDIRSIDNAVRHILFAKFESGLFDAPFSDTTAWRSLIHTPQASRLARRMADESTVLLSNKDGFLPLDASALKSVAVIGPNADRIQFGDYSWSADRKAGISPYNGISSFLAPYGVKVNYAEGCDPYSQDRSGIASAVKAAKRSDVVLLFVGSQSAILARSSDPATCGEGYDLTDLKLPGVQMELFERLCATGKPVVVVLVTGKPFETDRITSQARATLVQWYAGEKAGESIAPILFGQTNPSGKLPVSFPHSVGHLPCYYNYLPTDKGYYNRKGTLESPGRDYVFSDPNASFSFGHGLSYTTFEYSDLALSGDRFSSCDTLKVSFKVRNTGKKDGMDVPQLYIRDKYSSVATPVMQLKDFTKIDLAQGDEKSVTLEVPIAQLSLHDARMERVVEDGEFVVMVGRASDDILLEGSFFVGGEKRQTGVYAGEGEISEAASQQNDDGARGEAVIVSGTVRNVQAAPLGGVMVFVRGDKSLAVVTGRDGKYSLTAKVNDILSFELDGYAPVRVKVIKGGSVDVDMDPAIR